MKRLSNLRRRVWDPLLQLLQSGMAPAQLAWSVSLGAYLGIIPMLGVTTLLCTVVALPLRFNIVAIQAVNWLVYPLQILLIIPFFRAGERLFRQPVLELAPADLVAMVRDDAWGTLHALWSTTWHALVAWLLLGLPTVVVTQQLLSLLFSRIAAGMHRPAIASEAPRP